MIEQAKPKKRCDPNKDMLFELCEILVKKEVLSDKDYQRIRINRF